MPSYARTCQQTFEHMDIWPDSVDTLSTEAWRDRSGRYWMCTDDKEIFYINYTGSRIADTRWENANYDTLFFYNTR
ncbi:MAG: hypothetical protein H6766_00675 [Candidatus Peribacteria bacterium]|nr:MAG: hypothetical protein H6766_00675 [Candidatus Peribacteria bacterium]